MASQATSHVIRHPTGVHRGRMVAGLLLLAAGSVLVVQALAGASPEATPTPDVEFSITAEEAREIEPEVADEMVPLPQGELGPHVGTDPVVLPPRDAAPELTPTNQLFIPSLRVSAPIEVQAMGADGSMSLPADLGTVGVLDTSSPLTASSGSTLLAGHVTFKGVHGVLFPLGLVRAGASVTTFDTDGARTDWRVTSVRSHERTSLPAEMFATSGPRVLTLVTCGGDFIRTPDGGWAYEDNIVVTAVPAS